MVSASTENRRTLRKLLIVSALMFGFGFTLIPFYRTICDALGLNNLLKPDVVAANTQVNTGRTLTVQFDSNLRGNLPWTFTPAEVSVQVHPGALTQVNYEVRNHTDHTITGQAIPSYGPQVAGRYFRKLDCFCFTQQTLAPGEVRIMPVAFVIDDGLPAEINTITLSYTFFAVEGNTKKVN